MIVVPQNVITSLVYLIGMHTRGAWFKFFNENGNKYLVSLYVPKTKEMCWKKGCPNGDYIIGVYYLISNFGIIGTKNDCWMRNSRMIE